MNVRSLLISARRSVAGLSMAAIAGAVGASAAWAQSPFGNWLTQDHDTVISIAACGKTVCGFISGIPLGTPGEPIPTDYRNRSQCHLVIISNGVPDGAGWRARIIDPRDGSTYRATLRVDAGGRLRVRGYIGIPLFGLTQVWTRYAEPVPADCRLSAHVPAPGVQNLAARSGRQG